MKSHYYALNTLVDDWIGRIVEVLKEQGQYDNTIIIYTSDHGDLLGDHGLIFKQCFYEQSVKAPLIIHAPTRFQARRVYDLVESLDIFSTICELGQAWPGEGIHGKSLVPLLRGEVGYTHRHAAFSENYFGKMVRHEQYKMVYYSGKSYGELYDLETDPFERHNLWKALEDSAVKRRLKDLLLEWMAVTEDQLPLPVRPDHFDNTPRQRTMRDGATALCERQPWYLDDLFPLYNTWILQETGIRR
jgi:arylsulfatase A-like enzyme